MMPLHYRGPREEGWRKRGILKYRTEHTVQFFDAQKPTVQMRSNTIKRKCQIVVHATRFIYFLKWFGIENGYSVSGTKKNEIKNAFPNFFSFCSKQFCNAIFRTAFTCAVCIPNRRRATATRRNLVFAHAKRWFSCIPFTYEILCV